MNIMHECIDLSVFVSIFLFVYLSCLYTYLFLTICLHVYVYIYIYIRTFTKRSLNIYAPYHVKLYLRYMLLQVEEKDGAKMLLLIEASMVYTEQAREWNHVSSSSCR